MTSAALLSPPDFDRQSMISYLINSGASRFGMASFHQLGIDIRHEAFETMPRMIVKYWPKPGDIIASGSIRGDAIGHRASTAACDEYQLSRFQLRLASCPRIAEDNAAH